MRSIWSSYLGLKQNRYNFISTLAVLLIVLMVLPLFLNMIESRDGFSFTDPLLSLFTPVDVTWLTFGLIYTGLITAIIHLSNHPKALVLALKVYALTAIIRIIAMYFLPLNPPTSMILLNDPFVQLFGSGEILTKDLFFSGHTSTLFILFLTAQSKRLKTVFILGVIFVAAAVLAQHVHYTIDVFAAPFFTYCAYRVSLKIDSIFNKVSL